MKILLCTPYFNDVFVKFPGGISVWAKNLYTYYQTDSRDVNLEIFPTTRSKDINERTPKIVRVYEGIKDYGRFLFRIYQKLKSEQFDAIQFTSTADVGLYKDLVTIRIAKKCGTKSIVHFHFGRIPELSRIQTKEWKMLCRVVEQADKAIVIDQASYDTLLGLGYKNVVYLPNPLSEEVVNSVRKYQGQIQRIPRRILFAARVFRQKGIYELVEACTKIPGIQLRVVGNIEEEVKNELYDIAGHADWLVFVGVVKHEDVIKELLACDIHILPTYNEGFPNAILECMACGAPTITTPVGAIPEMMNFDGEEPCGRAIRKQNVEDIITAIEELIDNEPQKRMYAERSQKRVAEMYSEKAVYEMQYSIWKSI